ncbi:MAG: hypothetical protein R3C52_10140 [Hyphomonadaceae bacterium]
MKYEFASPGWIAFMHGMMVERLRRLLPEAPDISWSICEVFTNPPKHLSPSGAPLVWSCVVDRGQLDFGTEERDDVEFKVVADYAAIVALGRYDTRGDPVRMAELASLGGHLKESGQLQVMGDKTGRDARVGDFHDPIARVTA